MKKIFLISIILIAACSKDSTVEEPNGNLENPTEEPSQISREIYFTYNSNPPTNPQEDSENWVVVHNSKGEILNYRKYEIGDDFSFESRTDSITPKISVTYITINKSSDVEDYQINTTTDLEKGFIQNINFFPSEIENPIEEGQFDITIKNIPLREDPGFSNIKISSEIGRLGGTATGTVYPNGMRDMTLSNIPKYDGLEEYFIAIIDENNNLKFYPVYNSGVEDLELDYQTQFVLPDKEISFNLPPHESFYLNVAGFRENQDFGEYYEGALFSEVISSIDTDISTNPLRIGYSNHFPKFRTQFSIRFSDYSYYIGKYGSALEAINIPEKPNFVILDNSIQNFSYEVELDFNSANHTWRYTDSSTPNLRITAYWSISNPVENANVIGTIPNEILEEYPNLSINKLEYDSTTFTFQVPGGLYNSRESITLPAQ